MTEHHGPDTWTENLKLYEEGRFPPAIICGKEGAGIVSTDPTQCVDLCQSGVSPLNQYEDPFYNHSMTVLDQVKATNSMASRRLARCQTSWS
jgi:hypothetical protein